MPVVAQPALSPDDLIIRPGDTIVWSASTSHQVQFGGIGLTPLDDVNKVLTFTPALTVTGNTGLSAVGGDPMLTATVKSDAAGSGVAAIVFTCGKHPGQMKTKPFPVQAATRAPRTIKIKSDPNGNNWLLEKDGGTVIIDASLARDHLRFATHGH
jgi:hypothetical protein